MISRFHFFCSLALSQFTVMPAFACNANANVALDEQKIISRKGMTPYTVSFCGIFSYWIYATEHIFAMRNWSKMIWIHAFHVSANMIEFFSYRNGSVEKLIDKSVCKMVSSESSDTNISCPRRLRLPFPASFLSRFNVTINIVAVCLLWFSSLNRAWITPLKCLVPCIKKLYESGFSTNGTCNHWHCMIRYHRIQF